MGKLVRSPLFLMALTIFLDFTGFGLIIPLLPFWAEHLGANALGVGSMLTIYALAQFCCTPVLGMLSDRYGRRRVILFSLCVEIFACALTALAGSLPLLLIARMVGGIGASNVGSAQAVVADVTPPEKRAAGMGTIGAAIGLGFVVGPAIGGILAAHGEATPFWMAMGMTLANALLVLFLLPETRRHQRVSRRGLSTLFVTRGTGRRNKAIASLVLVNLLFTLAFTGMEAVFPLLTEQHFGWQALQNGYIFTYIGVLIVLMQGGLVRHLVKRFGEVSLLLAGLALSGLGLLLLVWSVNLAPVLISVGLFSIGDGAVTPTGSAVLSLIAPENEQGKILGWAQGLGGLGRACGPLIAGALFSLGSGLPFLAGGVFALLAILVTLLVLPDIQYAVQMHKGAPPAAGEPAERIDPVGQSSR
jgi:multidrug resistance protein